MVSCIAIQHSQFQFSHSFAHTLFYLTYKYDPIRCYYSWSEWTLEQWKRGDTPLSPELQDWSLTNRRSFVLHSGHFVGAESYPFCWDAVSGFYCSSCLSWNVLNNDTKLHPYLPTLPLGQDMTQGQFLTGLKSEFSFS